MVPRLITIPISHYCEKARWALELAEIEYVESAHLQLLHYWPAWRAGGGRTVPVLVTRDEVLTESSDILHWANQRLPAEKSLYPKDPALCAEVEQLEQRFDDQLGPDGRLWMYSELLDESVIFTDYGCTGVPGWQRAALPLLLPVARIFLRRLLSITPEAARDAALRVDQTLDDVAKRLADGRRYLVGDRFSAADLSFAALSAAILAPDRYGVPLPRIDEVPASTARAVARWRDHPAGRFALRLFAEERPPARGTRTESRG